MRVEIEAKGSTEMTPGERETDQTLANPYYGIQRGTGKGRGCMDGTLIGRKRRTQNLHTSCTHLALVDAIARL